VVGTQGTPVEVLGKLIQQSFYPELWEARDRLTALSAEPPGEGSPGHGSGR
jgi:tryptophan 2,3-dioxygenase